MKAIVLDGPGGPDRLALGEAPKPSPGPGQVLLAVAATSVNRADIMQREGKYPPPPGESGILGLEVAGTVEELGAGVSGWKRGDRVMSLVAGGGYAEYATAYAGHLLRVPEGMGFRVAATVCEAYITAFLNVFLLGELRDGGAVLLHGGGGGVNTAAIQLCRALAPSCTIVVTASRGKLERVKELGADVAIDYAATPEFSEAVKASTGGAGVDVVLDHIGGRYLEQNMRSLALGGRLVVIGVMGGAKSELNLAQMMVRRQRIVGSVLRSLPVEDKSAIVAEFARRAMPHISSGAIVPVVERAFPLAEASEAHRMMEESRHFGKIVLEVRP